MRGFAFLFSTYPKHIIIWDCARFTVEISQPWREFLRVVPRDRTLHRLRMVGASELPGLGFPRKYLILSGYSVDSQTTLFR